MNKIYKVIWNATLSAWVAVSELAKGKTKSSKVTGIIGAATVSLMITFSSDVTANVINTDSNNCITGSNGIVGTINPGTTGGQATDGSGTYSTVAGCNAKGNGLSAVTAYGSFAEVTGNAGTAVGHNSQANAFGTAVGVESRATGVGSTALGEGSQSTGQNAVALGGTATGTAAGNVLSVANAVTASGSGAVAIGGNAVKGAQSAGTDAVAIGAQSTISTAGTGAVALGARTNATASGAVAIGDGANASIAGSTALGTSTTTSASVNSTAQTINGKSYTATGTASTGVVSVGSSTIKRQIQNVAAGQVTASSTDAINGSQLFNTNTELAKVAADTATALGGGAAAGTAAGGITAPSYTITKTDASTTTVNNVGAALSALNAEVVKPITFTGTTGTTSQKLGSSVAVIGDSKNISTAVTANQIKVSISDNPTFTSVTTGNTVLNNAGVTADQVAVGGVVINKTTGINAGGLAITNVAAPTAGTDATNKTYVDSKAAASKTEVTGGSNIAGVTKTTGANGQDIYTVNANGTTASAGSSAVTVTAGTKDANNVTDYKVDLATSTKTDIQKGVDAKTAVDNTGLTFKGDTAATSTTKKLGDTVSITGDTNISTVATANGVQVKLNPNLDLGAAGSVKTGNTTINNAGVTADQVAVGGVVINKTTGINAGGLAITNVAAPIAGTDATNKTYVDSKAAASKTEVAGGSNIAGVAKTTGANGQDVYTVNANGTTASAGSSAVTVTAGTKDANNVTDYKVDLAAATKTDIAKGVAAKAAVDNTGLTFKGDTAATSTTKKLGDTVSISGDTNISTVATTDGVQVKLNPNLDLGAAGSVTTGNSKLDNSGLTITGGPSVTSTGINAGNKTITNVAAPTNNTDAANKKYVDDAGATLTNLGFGLKAQDGTTVNKKLGEAVEVVGSNSNITTKVNAGKVEVALSNALDLGTAGSVTTGATVINNAGITANKVTVNNAPTAGTDATNKTYVDSKAAASKTEVAGGSNIAGVAKTTGANGQDVYTVNANGTTASAGSSAVTVTAGTKDANNVTDYKVDLATSTKTDIQKGVDAKTAVDNTGLTFKGDTAATSTTKKLGDTVSITGDTNISTVATTDGVQVKLNPNLDLGTAGSVKTGNTTINNAGVTADQVTVGGVVINNTTGINAGGKAITNVAAPTNNTDAANKKYVDDAGSTLTNLGFGLKAQDGTTVNKKLGEAVDIVGSNSNITTKVNAGKVEVALSNALDLGAAGSVTTGATVINNAGITATQVTANKVTVNNAPTAGTDATNKTYVDSKSAASKTEVAGGSNIAGVAKTTGANGQDIYTVNANGTTASAGSSAVTVTAGTKDANNVTDYKVDLATSTKTDIQKGVDAKTAVDNTGLTFKGDTAATSTTKKLGDTVSITGDTNISTVATTDGVQVKLNPNLDLGAAGSVITGNSKLDNSGLTITGGPSVTSSGINAANKNISNVADATTDDQAVNKGQLDAATTASSSKTDALGNSTATNLGGGSKYDNSTGSISAPSYVTTKTDGTTTTANNVGDALTNLNTEVVKPVTFTGNSGTVDRKLGETLNITGGLTGAGSNSNIKTVITGNTLDIQLADAPVFAGKVTANGLDANGNKVENVADATAASDAVNKGQLDAATTASSSKTDALGNSTATNLGGGSKYDNSTGAISAPSYVTTKTDGTTTTANNVGDALTNLNTEVVKPVTFTGNSGTVDRKLGETLNITGGLTGAGSNSNIKTVITGNTLDIQLADAPVFAGKVTVNGLDANGNKVENVADATAASDAVNKGQLDAATTASSSKTDTLGNSTATNLGGGSKYDNSTGAISAPSYVTTKTDGTTTTANNVGDALTNLNSEVVKPVTFTGNSGTVDRKLGETLNITGGLTGAGSNSNIKTVITGNTLDIQLADAPVFAGKVTANGLDANGNKVENVADATAASDAVNKGQLDAATTASSSKTDTLGNSTATNLGGGSKYDNSTGAISAPSYVTTKTDGTTTTANNVGDALTNLNSEVVKPVTFTGNSGTVDRKLGETLNITGGLTGAGSNSNIKTVITGNTLDIQLADAPVFAGKVTANGLDANGNKVENVADATAASDAVNKGQLDAATTASSSKTDTLGNSTATNLGGGSKYDNSTGAISAPSYVTTKTDGTTTTANNVGDALTNLNSEVVKPVTFTGNSGTVDRKLGETLNITGGLTGAGSNSNIKTVITGNTLDIQLADAPVFAGKVTANGLDANGNKVENVADATAASDAVNKGQLDAATTASSSKTDALGNSTATNLGGGSKYDNSTGAISAPSYVTTKTDGTTTTANNVGDALTNLNTEVVKPVTFTGNSGTVDRKLGETLNITGGLTGTGSNSNIKTVITGNTLDIQLADAPVFAGKVTANGLDANGNKVENVADATAASDAVNKGQLDAATTASSSKTDALGNSTATNLGGGSKYDNSTGAISAPSYVTTKTDGTTTTANNVGDALTNLNTEVVKPVTFTGNSGTVDRKLGETLNITGGLTGTGSNSNIKTVITGNTLDIQLADAPVFAGKVTANGLDANGNKVENVADATAASDAVNKGQLDAATTASSSKTDALGNSTATNLGGGSKYDNSTGAISAPSYVTTKTDGTTTTANNVGDALTNLNTEVVKPVTFTGNSGTVDRKLGETLNITGGLTGTGSNSNIKTVITGNTLDIQLADAPVFAGKVTANGLDANGNKVENVADATAASDAVNKGQLDAATTASSSKTDALGNSTATNLGGGSKYDNSTGAISAPSYVTTKTDGTTTTANNVGDALTNLNTEVVKPVTFTGNSGTVDRKLGETLNITGGLTGTGSNSNIKTVITGNTLDIQLADAPVFAGKVTANGLDANGNKVENVADATAASDAVNKGQLDSLSTGLTNTGFGLKAADGNTVNKKLGEAVEVVGADSNITTKVTNGQVAIELNKNLNNLTGITVNDGTNGTNGSTVIGKDGISVKDGSGNTIVGLDNTALTVKDGSGNTETSINKAINTLNASQGETDKFAVKYDKNADGSANYDNVTLAGTGGTTITNVKAGAINATSTDAINGSQLYDVGNSLKNAIGGLTTRDATTGIITTSNIGGTGSNTIDGAINSIKDSATKAKTTVTAGDNVVVTAGTNADGSSNYQVATAKDVNFDKVTVGNVVVNKASDTIEGLSNKDLTASDFATKGRAATEEQLKQAVTKNITEVVDGNGNKVNIIDQVVNTKPDNKNQDSLFLTYDKQGQETTDRLTIGQTVQKMNTDGIKFFHTNADMSKGDLGTTNDSSAGGLNSTAIGVNAIVASGADSSVALGHNTKANGKESIAIGYGAEALGTQSISIGTGNKVKGNHSGAIGDPTIVDGANSYSVGNNNQVLTDDTFVLGNNVTKTVAGSVVLGNGSAATTSAGVTGYALSVATSADKTAISNTTSTTGAVAVGDAASGIYRQITGVAAGSADADAVNVAQLKAVGNQVVTTQNALVNGLGGNAKVNADGTITGPTYNVAQGNQSNVGDALTALDKAIGSAATTSKTTVSNGQNIVVNKSKNADGSDNYEVSTAKDLTVDSVKAGDTVLNNAGISIGNNAVVINNTGLTIAGGPSVTVAGINAGNKTITNVANAVNATDAVNKGQLDSAIGTVNNNVNELANNAVKYDDASKDKITLGGGANGTTISNVKDGAVSQGSKDAVNGGQLWNVQQQVDQNSTDISNIKNDINNGTVGLVQQAGKDATVTVAKDTGGTSVSVAGTDGNRVVTGVKDGAVNATSKDAVNGSQLNTTNQAVVNYLGGGAGYDNITGSFTAPTYNVGDSKYNNVGGAIDALNQADQALNSKIDNVSNKLDNAFRITNNRIDDVEKKANAGIAAAMALESAPYIPGKYTYAAGAAYHGGENAVGVTLRKTADNGRWSITGGVAAASQGDPSVRIGISGVID